MSDARLIHPTTKPMRGGPATSLAPSDASQAAATLLRYGWQKLCVHVKHSYPWIILCTWLLYGYWTRGAADATVPAQPVAASKAIVGAWFLAEPQYTVLEFYSDGTVISRNALKEDKGTYLLEESRILLKFSPQAVFWHPAARPMPDRFAISGDELSLYATSGGADIGTDQVYRFKRKLPSADASDDLAAWAPTQ